jgi:hypothetical protein
MPQKKQSITDFRFVTEQYITEHHHQLTRSQFERLRGIYPRHLYWCQPCGKGGSILWNLQLFLSLMAHGADSVEHRKLLAEFMATIPQAALVENKK